MSPDSGTSARQPTGLEIAMQWAELPAEHMKIALDALEPQLRREHEMRVLQQKSEHQLALAQVRAQEESAKRAHMLYLGGLIAGFAISVGMLSGAVVVGVNGQPWLAAMLSGPSVLALTTLFVLRRNEQGQAQAVAAAQRSALNVALQPPPG
ncbi:hypothetical protein GCM10012285_41950 [Streptomyces kronopolitis]|uniref:DUF2335 domain-containing protein n=2 Tax=Streptomyces kronopolitis TaxID=1612435 RepID=A0ABQ2JP16_9ACTN|nr:hypothetical protein GCM10012285_41950 [Streptomyces kronopolitis]